MFIYVDLPMNDKHKKKQAGIPTTVRNPKSEKEPFRPSGPANCIRSFLIFKLTDTLHAKKTRPIRKDLTYVDFQFFSCLVEMTPKNKEKSVQYRVLQIALLFACLYQ
jgi:hypothetical protein